MNITKFFETTEASLLLKLNDLKKHNIVIDGTRTSLTLEPLHWDILHEIAQESECSIHDLCTMIKNRKASEMSMSAAIRIFSTGYLFLKYKKNLK